MTFYLGQPEMLTPIFGVWNGNLEREAGDAGAGRFHFLPEAG